MRALDFGLTTLSDEDVDVVVKTLSKNDFFWEIDVCVVGRRGATKELQATIDSEKMNNFMIDMFVELFY